MSGTVLQGKWASNKCSTAIIVIIVITATSGLIGLLSLITWEMKYDRPHWNLQAHLNLCSHLSATEHALVLAAAADTEANRTESPLPSFVTSSGRPSPLFLLSQLHIICFVLFDLLFYFSLPIIVKYKFTNKTCWFPSMFALRLCV